MSCSIPEGKAFLNRLFKDPNRVFHPADYTHIILVDFFFCLDFSFLLRDRNQEKLRIQNTLISDTLYSAVLDNQLGVSSYNEGSVVGLVKRNSTVPLIRKIRSAAPSAQVYLTPRPFIPSKNAGRGGRGLSVQAMQEGTNIFEKTCRAKLDAMQITYIHPTSRLICADTGLTRDHFSVGPRANAPDELDELDELDEHMNAAYGQVTMKQITENTNF